MSIVQAISAFLAGLVLVAAASVLVRPGSQTASVVGALGDSVSKDIGAAKS